MQRSTPPVNATSTSKAGKGRESALKGSIGKAYARGQKYKALFHNGWAWCREGDFIGGGDDPNPKMVTGLGVYHAICDDERSRR